MTIRPPPSIAGCPCGATATRGRRGYVLLLVLLLLALASVALATACRSTLRRSSAATAAAADLQHRWGATSAQYTLLDNAANVLDLADPPGGPPAVTLHGSLTLGGLRFDVDMSDEQAKANVNGLLAWHGHTAAEGIVRDLARSTGGRLAPRLPAGPRRARSVPTDADEPTDDAGDRVTPIVGCLTDAFPGAGWADLVPSSPGSLSRSLTCYGDGKVNVRRASVAVLSAACGPALSPAQVSSLSRRARSAGPTFDVAAAVAATGASPAAAAGVVGRLIDGSFTQSVWVTATDGRRVWRSWAVRDATDGERPRTVTGQW